MTATLTAPPATAAPTPEPAALRFDWTRVGADFNTTPEQRDVLLGVFTALDAGESGGWLALPGTLPAMPGLAIEEVIAQLRMPRVTHVGVSNVLAPYGLLAIRAHYSGGRQRVELLAVDRGTSVSPLVTRVHPLNPE